MLHIKCFTFNPFQENTYLLYDEEGTAALIDPGCYTQEERRELEAFMIEEGLQVTQLLNTHCHIDHVLGNAWAIDRFQVSLQIHALEVAVLKSVEVYAPNYGFLDYVPSTASSFLVEGQEIQIGNELLRCLFVPGHAPGHLVFYHKASKRCIAGDTLFRGSIGRTDLPGGDPSLLLEKIKSQLFVLPEETLIFPGHGPETSIGYEKKNNPFVGLKAYS
ncbi:MAG: MBL fold metallo-hydrolase [Bacteroidetes bacterium]|nr:MBL fold metallo-hydrolase [Bacteroidota bacterium]MDA1267593.1 MBL fold metallo-hydrolase [Bacteroidota bacterium]